MAILPTIGEQGGNIVGAGGAAPTMCFFRRKGVDAHETKLASVIIGRVIGFPFDITTKARNLLCADLLAI